MAADTVDKTLTKGLHLLELLGQAGGCGVSVLAAKAGLTKSNVHRLMQTLCRAGWVRKVEADSSYRLSGKAWEIGQNWISGLDLPRIAGSQLTALAARTQETVHLGVLEGDDVVFVVTLETPLAVRAYTPLGSRAPAHRVATGKAILAFLAAAGGAASKREKEFDLIRRRGYAINRSEWQEGVNGIAAPIFAGANAQVIASVGLSGPAGRLNQTAMRRLAPLVQGAARAISQAVGR